MFDRCFTLFDRYVLAVRRCLRDALRKWQVQYVTDFGISIGECLCASETQGCLARFLRDAEDRLREGLSARSKHW